MWQESTTVVCQRCIDGASLTLISLPFTIRLRWTANFLFQSKTVQLKSISPLIGGSQRHQPVWLSSVLLSWGKSAPLPTCEHSFSSGSSCKSPPQCSVARCKKFRAELHLLAEWWVGSWDNLKLKNINNRFPGNECDVMGTVTSSS